MLFDDVIDVGHSRANKECKDESKDIILFALFIVIKTSPGQE